MNKSNKEAEQLYFSALQGDLLAVIRILQRQFDACLLKSDVVNSASVYQNSHKAFSHVQNFVRYTHDLPLRWATASDHPLVALVLLVHGSLDLSWAPSDCQKSHSHGHRPCCARLPFYDKELICRLVVNYVAMDTKIPRDARTFIIQTCLLYADLNGLQRAMNSLKYKLLADAEWRQSEILLSLLSPIERVQFDRLLSAKFLDGVNREFGPFEETVESVIDQLAYWEHRRTHAEYASETTRLKTKVESFPDQYLSVHLALGGRLWYVTKNKDPRPLKKHAMSFPESHWVIYIDGPNHVNVNFLDRWFDVASRTQVWTNVVSSELERHVTFEPEVTIIPHSPERDKRRRLCHCMIL